MAAEIILWVFFHKSQNTSFLENRKSLRFSGKKGICAGGILLLVFFAALAAVWFRPAVYYDMAYRAEEHAFQIFQKFKGNAETPINGDISRGNNYKTGAAQLEITVSEKPSETLYLKGFGGGEYAGNSWKPDDEEPVFADTCQILQWDTWLPMIDGMFGSMYFLLNQNTLEKEAPVIRTIYIRHIGGGRGNTYVPYYSVRGMNKWWDDGEEDGYGYRYYEQKDMIIDWDRLSGSLGNGRNWYRQLQDAYKEAAEHAYISVPREQLLELTRFAEENPQESLDEISAFILYQLKNRASYTRTPGWAPLYKDITEYFFFESGQGYCQHFAAAAVLLYRLYGVPARYAAGYALQPSDFQRKEDGNWTAEATDESAHAWAEIFIEDYGWVPVEVTPASDGTIPVFYPGFDSAVGKRVTDALKRDAGNGNRLETGRDREEKEAEEGYFIFFDFEKYREIYLVLGSCSCCILLFLPILFDYRRLRYRQRLAKMNSRKIFTVLMRMLHYAGYFREMEGWEEDFALEVSGEFPQVTEEEIRRLTNIVTEAAYGPQQPEEEKEQYVRWIYFRLWEQVYGRMKGYRRMFFKYWRGFG